MVMQARVRGSHLILGGICHCKAVVEGQRAGPCVAGLKDEEGRR